MALSPSYVMRTAIKPPSASVEEAEEHSIVMAII
jgi:hypothetical protein